MEVEQTVWGFGPEGEAIILYTMRNKSGAAVQLTNIGASIVAVAVPDKEGNLADVALGYKDFMSYFNDGPAMGKTVGRYANRIANGAFTLDGVTYRLAVNNGPNHLHGGPTGFANRIWESRVETDRVVFSLVSPDGDENYPGELGVEVVYDWDEECSLEITYYAKCSAPTIVNLTNHAYFNLGGEASGSVLGQTLRLNAANWLPTDPTQIPTGEIAGVEGTPMDFRKAKPLGQDIDEDFEALKIGKGYDHCWVVDNWEENVLAEVAELADPVSGRVMTVYSSQPGAQVYTGNWLAGSPAGKSGRGYDDRDGVAIECQRFPDTPNKPEFPSARLDPDQIYVEKIVYKFGVTK